MPKSSMKPLRKVLPKTSEPQAIGESELAADEADARSRERVLAESSLRELLLGETFSAAELARAWATTRSHHRRPHAEAARESETPHV